MRSFIHVINLVTFISSRFSNLATVSIRAI